MQKVDIYRMKKILSFALAALMVTAFPSCTEDRGGDATDGWEKMFQRDDPDPEEDTTPDDYDPEKGPWFLTRGIVCCWTDVSKRSKLDYIDIAKRTGLNCFSIYNADLSSAVWQSYTGECSRNGIDIEFEEHMLSFLLPRELYQTHPEYFRMNDRGVRVDDANGCPSNEEALAIIRERAKIIGEKYKSTNNKYYCWLDDTGDICHCPDCKGLNPADQSLLFENVIIEGLKEVNPDATLAHLAYYNTVEAPKTVKPVDGIFLEFAPIDRDHYHPLSTTWASGKDGRTHGQYLKALSDNLKIFPKETAQVLEYWLDCSLFSNWDESNLKEVAWNQDLFEDDIKTYASYGIRHVMTYTSYISANYVAKFGYPSCIDRYAEGLRDFVKK